MQKVKAFGEWLTKWFTAIVIVWAVFNYFVPQASLWGKSYTGYFLGIVLFGMGLTLTLDDFKRILTQPLMLAVGVILVGCCPSGTSSNVMSYLSRGDVALDVSIGILSTLCAPFMIPLLMQWLASQYVTVPVESLFLNAVKVVLFPIALGVICHMIFGKKIEKITVANRLPGRHPAHHRRGGRGQRAEAVRGLLPAGHSGGHAAQSVRLRAGLRILQADVQGVSEGFPLCAAEGHHLRGRHAGFRFGCHPGPDLLRVQPVGSRAVHLLQRVAQHLRLGAFQLVAGA